MRVGCLVRRNSSEFRRRVSLGRDPARYLERVDRPMTPPVRRSRRSLPVLITLAAVACGGGGPSGGGETVVLIGTWDVVHVFTVGPQTLATCGGQLIVGSQSGGSFSGQITIPADGGCAGLTGEGTFTFYTTGDPAVVAPVVARLWEDEVAVRPIDT